MESSLAEEWDWRRYPPREYGRLHWENRHGSHVLDQLLGRLSNCNAGA